MAQCWKNWTTRIECLCLLCFFQNLERRFLPSQLKKKKKKGKEPWGNFILFTFFFFLLNTRITRGVLDIFLWLFDFYNQRTDGMWRSNVGTWDASAVFGRHPWHIPVAKYIVSSCYLKRRLILFLMVQRIAVLSRWFVVGDFFFLLFSFT